MKKRVLALLMCAMMSVTLLTGCGDAEEADVAVEETDEAEEADEVEEDEADDADSEGCSDESFAAIQEAYAALVEEYNAVTDYYVSNDDIEKDEEVEGALATAKDYLEQVGEIEQSSITEEDAETLADSMLDVAEGLKLIAEGLGIEVEGAESDASEDASGEGCSDETFEGLQEAYSYLVEGYNTVTDYYLSNDDIAKDEDVEEALASAKEYLEQVGEIDQADITEDDALTLIESMEQVADGLDLIAQGLTQ